MAAEPECMKCGDYVHWGPVLCEKHATEAREALKELWQAVQKSNDPQSPDFIPASLPMFRVADDIAERYPFVKEADSEPAK